MAVEQDLSQGHAAPHAPARGRDVHDRQRERWLLLKGEGDGRSLAIFVHGFLGNHLTTWGKLPEFLKDHADSEEGLRAWDFLFVGYSTRDIDSYLDIAHLLATQLNLASAGEGVYAAPYRRFALLGHSLGTLGIRQFLCNKELHGSGVIERLHSVTLFGTPLNGSPWAPVGRLVGGPIARALEATNPQLRMLRAWNETVHSMIRWPSVRLVLGLEDKVVGSAHGDLIRFSGDHRDTVYLSTDHSAMVKPEVWAGSYVRDIVIRALS